MKNELREKREELNLTLQDVADYVGVSAGTVSRWETGNINNMKRDKIAKLSEILQLNPSVITGWETVKIENEGNISEIVLRTEEMELIRELRKDEPLTIDSTVKILEYAKKIKEARGFGTQKGSENE